MAWPVNEPPRPPSNWTGFRPQVSPPPPPADSQGLLWAFIPMLTCGFGTPFSFAYAAVKTRSAGLGAAAATYAGGTFGVLALMGDNAVLTVLAAMLLLTLWVSGTVHAFVVRPRIFPKTAPGDRANQHAIHVARYRRNLRQEARMLAASDPALAHELGIGRPDLPRAYDDGGLIDVNSAPPPVLAMLPGMTTELVERLVERRDEQGGFFSAEELAVDIDLPPDLLPRLAEYAIFLPR
jgi:DNA uptake protein ComE-like DNA-binding protein